MVTEVRHRRRTGLAPVGAFAGGCLFGAIASGLVVAGVAQLASVPSELGFPVAVVVAVAVAAGDLGVVAIPVPGMRRQVPQTVFHRGLSRGAFQFGVEMGTGMRTYMTTRAPVGLVVLMIIVNPGFWIVMAAAVSFGFARAVVPMTLYLSPLPSSDEWRLEQSRRATTLALRAAIVSAFVAAVAAPT